MKTTIQITTAVLAALSLTTQVHAKDAADMVLYHGKVLTVDKAFSIKSAIVVKDGKILAVGGDDLAERYTAAHRVDLKGRTLMPGFMDTHLHIREHSHRDIEPGQGKVHPRYPAADSPDGQAARAGGVDYRLWLG